AIAYGEAQDAIGFLCWLFRSEVQGKINAEFDQISDDKAAFSQAQREEMLATISADSLAAERAECALLWHADAKGEVLDFRPTTTPMAAIGVRLVHQPRAEPSGT